LFKEEVKRFLEANENENTTSQNLWDTAKAVLKVYSHECMYLKDRKISNPCYISNT
jgi:hypothetical protein